MLVKFIGVPGEEHDSIHMYGYHFPLDEPVVVTDELAVRKLSKHPHFAHKPEPAPAADPQEAELQQLTEQALDAPAQEAAPAADPQEEQHDTAAEAAHDDTQPARNEGAAEARRGRRQRGA